MQQYTHTEMDGLFGYSPFTLPDGRQFPSVWWKTSSPQEKANMGFVEYVPPLEELKKAKRRTINIKLNGILTGGYTVENGPMQGKILQTRNMEDRTNWLTSQASYSAAVAAGHGEVIGAQFRTADNETFTLTFADGLSVLMDMAAWGASCMSNSWALKDAVAEAEDEIALDAIDIDAGWPA